MSFFINYILGTFSKKSKIIKGRKPLVCDYNILDYNYNSDDEWEDDIEGEDVNCSDHENEKDEKDELSDDVLS